MIKSIQFIIVPLEIIMSEEKEVIERKEEASEDHLEKDSSETLKKRERMPPSDKVK